MQKSFKQIKLTFTFLSLLALLVVSLVLFIAQIAFAQTPATSTSVAPMPIETRTAVSVEQAATATVPETLTTQENLGTTTTDLRRADIAEKRALIETRRAEGRAILAETTQTRVTTIAGAAAARLTATIDKLALIAVRLRVYALDLQARGVDVTAELTALSTIETLFADARSSLEDIDVEIEFVVTSDTPRDDWAAARAQFAAISDTLKEAYELLRETITALKAAEMNS